ncbi:hypothetical protein [Synechococcus sp. 8F6]|uniref:hypothetical protein n=1 Tax=Synechococcus sp. 8F6 TaxID=2025606 RepID=UPI000B99A5A0|nr:hypothetical protein [Synechococcus sp. 8F6]
MALFQWIAAAEQGEFQDRLASAVGRLNLEIDQEFSNSGTIYARDKDGLKTSINARGTVMISPNNETRDELQVEVRSSEPMLKRGTRCEQIANDLKAVIPAKP